MRLNPHLTFEGRCEEAFRFYAASLEGRSSPCSRTAESPLASGGPADLAGQDPPRHPGPRRGALTGADVSIEGGYRPPEGFSVLLEPASTAEAVRMFARLSEGGTVRMPLQKTFWAERFGMLTDRFGIPWMLNCSAP